MRWCIISAFWIISCWENLVTSDSSKKLEMALHSGSRDYDFYEDMISSTLFLKLGLKKVGFNTESSFHFITESPFQRVQIIESSDFGKTLVIDDQIQSSALDEHVYHEALVHPVLMAHGSPKTVFIGGGGEGATAREVLKWKSVESVVMCDIDEITCKACREHVRTLPRQLDC